MPGDQPHAENNHWPEHFQSCSYVLSDRDFFCKLVPVYLQKYCISLRRQQSGKKLVDKTRKEASQMERLCQACFSDLPSHLFWCYWLALGLVSSLPTPFLSCPTIHLCSSALSSQDPCPDCRTLLDSVWLSVAIKWGQNHKCVSPLIIHSLPFSSRTLWTNPTIVLSTGSLYLSCTLHQRLRCAPTQRPGS